MIGSVQVVEAADLKGEHLPQVLVLWSGATMIVSVSPTASELDVVLAIKSELGQIETALRG